MTAWVKVAGTWRQFNPKVKVAGAWKTVSNGFVKVAGTWRKFYGSITFDQPFGPINVYEFATSANVTINASSSDVAWTYTKSGSGAIYLSAPTSGATGALWSCTMAYGPGEVRGAVVNLSAYQNSTSTLLGSWTINITSDGS
jgi:hypothetical protein